MADRDAERERERERERETDVFYGRGISISISLTYVLPLLRTQVFTAGIVTLSVGLNRTPSSTT